jgi:hypothetical protein
LVSAGNPIVSVSSPLCGLLIASFPAIAFAQAVPASTAPPKEDATVKLAPFEVVASKGTRGYGTTNALGATRINAPRLRPRTSFAPRSRRSAATT